jgi:LAO/AO transport system kinase
LVENAVPGYAEWLASLHPAKEIPVIGITGPPGAGKSTLVNALICHYTAQGKRVGVIAIDPTSPFNLGSLLGDRVRMSEHYLNPNVFIRSLATRGSLGGLSAKAIEVTDVMKAAGFDYIIVETVGVGQSEVEIAGLADTTVVVLVPEGGDDIQGLKSGIMEIADIFVVNKCDRPGAKEFMAGLRKILHQRNAKDWQIPVLGTAAQLKEGIEELAMAIEQHSHSISSKDRKARLMAEKAWQLIQTSRMKGLSKKNLAEEIKKQMQSGDFNLYAFAAKYF